MNPREPRRTAQTTCHGRRGHGFASISVPLPERDQPGQLAAASKGTAYLDLAGFGRIPKWFVMNPFVQLAVPSGHRTLNTQAGLAKKVT